MQISVPAETWQNERRVALIPDSVQRLTKAGFDIALQSGAGAEAGYSDADYEAAGATISNDRSSLLSSGDVVLRVRKPDLEEVSQLKEGALHISYLDPYNESDLVEALSSKGITAISMEMIPRTTRAQKMDALSSQANLAGYVMVIQAAQQI